MAIYTVTFCTMDHDTGSSVFWHSCLLLSKLDDKTKKMEVVDTWGFYGLPSTVKDSAARKLKTKMSLDLDLHGNHGMLRHEEMRYLDLGCGLHGATFELTEEKFNALQKKCEKIAADQIQAINDIVEPLNLPGKPPEKTRIYPHEDYSIHILGLEQKIAKEQDRPSRLKPFELSFADTANTCKIQALNLLEGILTPEQIKRLTGPHRLISRFSGKTETLFLHSSGPLRVHTQKSGKVLPYRNSHDENVKLHWTLPPQEIETLSPETRDLLKISSPHVDDIKKTVSQLQRLEWLLIKASLEDKSASPAYQPWITTLREHYEAFAVIEPKKSEYNKSMAKHSLFSSPTTENEKILLAKLTKAKNILKKFHNALIDDYLHMMRLLPDIKSPKEAEENIDLKRLITHLTPKKKKELCKVITGQNDLGIEPLLIRSAL